MSIKFAADGIVISPNDPVGSTILKNDNFSLTESEKITGNLIANDQINNAFSVVATAKKSYYGDLLIAEDGTFSYQSKQNNFLVAGESLKDSFTYTVFDQETQSFYDATVQFNVVGTSEIVAKDIQAKIYESEDKSYTFFEYEDLAFDGAMSLVSKRESGQYGDFVVGTGGYMYYNLSSDVILEKGVTYYENFTYELLDQYNMVYDQGTVKIEIYGNGENQEVITRDDNYSLNEGFLSFEGNVFSNDDLSGADSYFIDYNSSYYGDYGYLTLNTDGDFVYQSYNDNLEEGIVYRDVFDYSIYYEKMYNDFEYILVEDNRKLVFNITGSDFNSNPLVADKFEFLAKDYETYYGYSFSSTSSIFLNDNNDVKPYYIYTNYGEYGNVTLYGDGKFVYNTSYIDVVARLGDGQKITDLIDYTAYYDHGIFSSTLEVTIIGQNDAPVIEQDQVFLSEYASNQEQLYAFDWENDTLSYKVLGGLPQGIAVSSTGLLTADWSLPQYDQLNFNQHLDFWFTLEVSDGKLKTSKDIQIILNGSHTNKNPLANQDRAQLTASEFNSESVMVSGNVMTNDRDTDYYTDLKIRAVNYRPVYYSDQIEGLYGTLYMTESGDYKYVANAFIAGLYQGVTAQDTFQYMLSDGYGGVAYSTLTITLNGKGGITEGDDILYGFEERPDILDGRGGHDQLYGLEGDDQLSGGAGNDYLDGGLGADTLRGGSGDDVYVRSDNLDVIEELADQGIDLVNASLHTALGANIENLSLQGAANLRGTGNELANIIQGNLADNTLSGKAGNDQLYGADGDDRLVGGFGDDYLDGGLGIDVLQGGWGNDVYVRHDRSDTIEEWSGQGTDLVLAQIDTTLGDHVENLTLQGTVALKGIGNHLDNMLIGNLNDNMLYGKEGNDQLYGGLGDDLLVGSIGNDYLDGGLGADRLHGGLGDDVYVRSDNLDVIEELANQGIDLVNASINTTLGAHLEHLTLQGAGNLKGTGNELANIIKGNLGNNILSGETGHDQLYGADGQDQLIGGLGDDYLDGGLGLDVLQGGWGNDVYVRHDRTDVIEELAGQGTDLVLAAIDTTLGEHVENLTLQGTVALRGIGNQLDNVLRGNIAHNTLYGKEGNDQLYGEAGNDTLVGSIGNDWLDGGRGADLMIGGRGNDTYFRNNSDDVVDERDGEGIDTVHSSISTTLEQFVENLILTGEVAVHARGNALDNHLVGNNTANTLTGGLGTDLLEGGLGADTYRFTRGDGQDTIVDVGHATAQTDSLVIGGARANQLWLSQVGDDLLIQLVGTVDQINIQGWFASTTYQIEEIYSQDGRVLHSTDVQTLVTAMSTMTPPAMGETQLSQSQQSVLSAVFATAWQATA